MDRYTVAVILDLDAHSYEDALVRAATVAESLTTLGTDATVITDYEKDNSDNRIVYLGNEYGNVVE